MNVECWFNKRQADPWAGKGLYEVGSFQNGILEIRAAKSRNCISIHRQSIRHEFQKTID